MWSRNTARGLETGCLEVWAPAKLNLFLEVLGKRDDGYHELETLMAPMDWYDTLYLSDDPTGAITLHCEAQFGATGGAGPSAAELPEGADNLVVRALLRLRERVGVSRGASIRLVKRIPIAAGLAGGSTDAAAALWGANRLWDLGLSDADLGRLGAELGSDIPFFFASGAAVCRGRGERIETLPPFGPWHFVVATPPERLSTARVFAGCRPAGNPLPLGPLLDAVRRGDPAAAGRWLHNRLQASAEVLAPAVARLREQFSELDLHGHLMSGSGSSYFGLCRHAAQARRLARRLRAAGAGQVFAVRNAL